MGEERYLEIARKVGLDEDEVKKVLAEKRYEDRIKADIAEATKYSVSSTPSSFVNGKRVKGAQPFEGFKKVIDKELGIKPSAAAPAATQPSKADKKPAPKPAPAAKPADGTPAIIAMGKAPVFGAKKAEVTIVTYSDFQ